ncbi:sigma-70 family RNA polymerase sigma factor [Negadavirga shengliensis]|uniref:Sigma-70 family RNA polymerase sigma factor n=1 Tax=Negadavirga shengliensis TaxID=1389218 RepID=A0ABV9T487_9BACT
MLLLRSHRQFKQIFEEYWDIMYVAAYSRIPNQEIVEDILQEIFVDIWQRRKSIVIRSTLKAYLLTAVKYKVLKHIDASRRLVFESIGETNLEAAREQPLALEDIYDQLEIVLSRLPEKQRLIFKMGRLEGFSAEEIAQALGLSTQTVHNHLSKSTKLVRAELKHFAAILPFLFIP